MKLTSNLFYYPWTDFSINNCNTYLIGNQSFILVDPGLDRCLPGVLDEMRKDGIDPDAIHFVIATHSHPDHFEGVRSFVNKGVKIALHPDEDAFLRQHGNGFYRMFGITLPAYQAEADFGEGAREINGTAMEIYHTPGHSPGSICLHCDGLVFTGDTLFVGGVGRTDLEGGSTQVLVSSIRNKLFNLPDSTVVLPGHNYGDTPKSTIGLEKVHNPYVGPRA